MRRLSSPKLSTTPRTIIGYHGCSLETAHRILEAGEFVPSTKAYDWLGEGIYFWEYAPYRALDWATERCQRRGGEPAVIKASIRLGRCLNLLDIEHIPGLRDAYQDLAVSTPADAFPRNTAQGAHFLDRAVIDLYCQNIADLSSRIIQTVRGSFAEGSPIFPASKILEKAHTQIAVRDKACILRLSLVEFSYSSRIILRDYRREP